MQPFGRRELPVEKWEFIEEQPSRISKNMLFIKIWLWNIVLDEVLLPARQAYPDSKIHGTNMGPIWGRQDLAIWVESAQVFFH